MNACPFCREAATETSIAWPLTAAFADAYPSSPGHVLIVPRRHVARIAELTQDETEELFLHGRAFIRWNGDPDGYTIGINDGEAAGQTVPHLHLHVIPRRWGDTADPRYGIRWAIPETADYRMVSHD